MNSIPVLVPMKMSKYFYLDEIKSINNFKLPDQVSEKEYRVKVYPDKIITKWKLENICKEHDKFFEGELFKNEIK